MSTTTVHLRAPQSCPDRAGPAASAAGVGPSPGTNCPRPGPLRLLVVEDEESVRASLKMLLQSDGHTVTTAMTAEEGFALFHQRPFDLVLTDYALPGMNGANLASAIHAEAASCPVIMITAYAQKLPRKVPYVDCILDKPFSIQDLRDAIVKVTRAAPPGRRPSPPQRGHSSV